MFSKSSRRSLRRRAGVVAGASVLALVATACSGGTSVGGGSDTSASSTTAGKGKVTGTIRLSYWGSGARVELTNGVSNLFSQAHAGTTVTPEFTDFNSYFQKLNIQATSGGMACVAQLQGRQLNDYAGKGLLTDLQPLVDSGAINVDNIPKKVLDTGRGTDGKLYEIPYGAAYDSIAVNTTLAQQAGVGDPKADWTWKDFQSYIKQAQGSLPAGTSAANLGGGLPNYFIEYLRSQGKNVFKGKKAGFTQKDLVTFWTMWEDLRKAGDTTTAQDKAAEPTQVEQSYLSQGKAMLDNKPGNQLGQIQGAIASAKPGSQVTTVQLPKGSDGQSGTVLFTSGWTIPKSCDNVPTAAAYIDFWVNDHAANKLFASNNGAVTNSKELQAQLEDPALAPAVKHSLELYQEIVKDNPPTVLFPAGYQANFETAFTRSYQDISLNGADIATTAKSFIDNLDSALAAA